MVSVAGSVIKGVGNVLSPRQEVKARSVRQPGGEAHSGLQVAVPGSLPQAQRPGAGLVPRMPPVPQPPARC